MKTSGHVELQVLREGKVVHSSSGPNTVVTAGKNLYAYILQSATPGRPTHFGFGSGTTAPDVSQTTLATEFTTGTMAGYARHAFAPTVSGNIVTYATNTGWTATAAGSLREIGIFTASTAGTMVARFLTTVFSLQTGDVLKMNWVLTVG